jgi:hypothetical protein
VIGWLPPLWTSLIKHVNAPVILVLFVNLAAAKNEQGQPMFGHFAGLVPWPYQVLGIVVFCTAAVIFLVGLFRPQLYMPLAPDDEPSLAKKKDAAEVRKTEKAMGAEFVETDDAAEEQAMPKVQLAEQAV